MTNPLEKGSYTSFALSCQQEEAAEMPRNKVTNLDAPPSVKWKNTAGMGIPRSKSKDSFGKVSGYNWIQSHFQKRECNKFISEKNKPGFCKCGRKKDNHSKKYGFTVVSDPDASWTPEQSTCCDATDTYGEIEFAEDPKSSRKPYIRTSHDTPPSLLLTLLTERWKLKVPNLVISVTGGAKSFSLKPRLKEAFSKGLIKVAESTGAWIITGGTSTGVMKHVGEAVAARTQIGHRTGKINCIGIAPWGQVDNADFLISWDRKKGLYPAHYTVEVNDATKAPLDINHSHFILVDNGTIGQYGVEIGLRSSLEGEIFQNLKTTSSSSAGSIGIPVVILCLEGGPNTIVTMAQAIKKGVPAVVIDGSGRAADIVAFAYNHMEFNEDRQIQEIKSEYIEQVKAKVEETFGAKNRDTVFNQIEDLLRDKQMVSIYRLDDEVGSRDIDLAILRSLLRVANVQSQLKLALAWNRIDVARSDIFDQHRDEVTMEHLTESMFTALMDDKVDFVLLFLNEGLKLKDFLTVDVLCSLYAGLPDNSPFIQLFNRFMDKKRSFDMALIGKLVEELMSDKYKSQYGSEEYIGKSFTVGVGNDKVRDLIRDANKVKEPWLDLFIWAILANRREMAKAIWTRGRESIAMALMATKLLKGIVEKVLSERDMVDVGADLLDHASEWEGTAIGVLDECRKQNDELAQRLIVKALPDFGHLTSIDIAVSAEDQDFIAHPTCQALLGKLWMGALALGTHTWQVGCCFFLFPLIPFIISFSGDNDGRHGRTEREESSNTHVDSVTVKDKVIVNPADEEMNVGSTTSFKDHDGTESVELHNYEGRDDDPIHQLVIQDDDDVIDVTLRNAQLTKPQKLIRFYQAPFVKFFANVLSYLVFLGLYSYNILSKFNIKPHWSEYILQAWVVTLIIEELRQVIMQEPKSFWGKLEWYFSSTWNIADVFSLSAFVVGTGFRYAAWHKNNVDFLTVARIIFATDVIIFIVRLLQIFSVNKNLGPKLVMIRKMLHDLKYFIFILAIFIIGYGIAFQSVRFPNTAFGKAVIGVLNKPYWQMYGELFIEEVLEDQKNCSTGQPICLAGGDDEPCSSDYGKYVAPIYMALYMLFTNILLLNLLIAIFNYTFEKVQDASDKVWKFQRYELILEYHDRPTFIPPFIIISHIFMSVRWLLQRLHCCGCTPTRGISMKFTLSNDENEQLRMWEYASAEAYLNSSMLVASETLDERVKYIQSRVDNVSDRMNSVICSQLSDDPWLRPDSPRLRASTVAKPPPIIEGRIAQLEEKMDRILELLIHQTQKQAALLQAANFVPTNEATDKAKPPTTITTIHIKARTSPYPNTVVQRAHVPDNCIPWETPFPEYTPVEYTAPVVLSNPPWADQDLSLHPRPVIVFNCYDTEAKYNRKSHLGEYQVVDGLPLNPMGRTGIVGRGLLGKWGPNHAVDPIVTRWKRSSSGIVLDKGKRVLEFVAIQRKDNHQWAIPGGMVDSNERVSETLRREFSEEAFGKLDMPEDKKNKIIKKIDHLFQRGEEVFKGYVDDPRNTDNSWMETVAYNFHDDTGEIFGELELKAGDDAEAVRWQRISGNIPLFASHVGILEKVAEMHAAAFY